MPGLCEHKGPVSVRYSSSPSCWALGVEGLTGRGVIEVETRGTHPHRHHSGTAWVVSYMLLMRQEAGQLLPCTIKGPEVWRGPIPRLRDLETRDRKRENGPGVVVCTFDPSSLEVEAGLVYMSPAHELQAAQRGGWVSRPSDEYFTTPFPTSLRLQA